MDNARSCPISYGDAGTRASQAGRVARAAREAQQRNHNPVHSIPFAHDLPSAINALNIINQVLKNIVTNEPQVNNAPRDPGSKLIIKGQDFDPQYRQLNWIQEGRVYTLQKLVNPDNPEQFIEINVLRQVTFFNKNTNYRFNYTGQYG